MSPIDTAQTRTAVAHARGPARATKWAIGLPLLRVLLVAAASALTWLILDTLENGISFPPPPVISVVAMIPVNIVCLFLVIRLMRAQGRRVREVLGFDPRRIPKDLLWGLLWLVVMYIPFAGTIMFVIWMQHASEMFVRMETVFVDPSAIPTLNPIVWSIIAIVGALTFAPLNAPTEELVYRGYSQGTLARRRPGVFAILVPSALFAFQHIWYAPTPDAVVAFVCAFFVWGVCSALIYHRQRRLMPLVFAHGLVNLVFTLPALPLLLTQNGI